MTNDFISSKLYEATSLRGSSPQGWYWSSTPPFDIPTFITLDPDLTRFLTASLTPSIPSANIPVSLAQSKGSVIWSQVPPVEQINSPAATSLGPGTCPSLIALLKVGVIEEPLQLAAVIPHSNIFFASPAALKTLYDSLSVPSKWSWWLGTPKKCICASINPGKT